MQNNLNQEETGFLQRIFDVDFIGLNLVTKEVAKNMIINDIRGHIVFVNPQSKNDIPESVADCVRKSIENLIEVLRRELVDQKSKIKATVSFNVYKITLKRLLIVLSQLN